MKPFAIGINVIVAIVDIGEVIVGSGCATASTHVCD